ncbi:hypothetical protein B0T26DRAFT_750861 [Lasiosphaeria miniovina]|uniref:Uncharacterized protein n=1 Tax=Lasiosphaeria miniovina TaxID=1954250 RepID=A0AA40AX30_9PEZI|nr:uncharacterized protein B0T26DRAFT_750861 [Lasiosphaeria miniovina]KAK0723602.1 hypothetical protein B0T26DRAFT_750861 [Lasiosphaeria miniovina]
MQFSMSSIVFAATVLSGLATAAIPAVCFDICNNALLEGNAVGWSNALCRAGSAFMQYKIGCNQCIAANGGGNLAGTQFAKVGQWCN